jgi:hypothetical protein
MALPKAQQTNASQWVRRVLLSISNKKKKAPLAFAVYNNYICT